MKALLSALLTHPPVVTDGAWGTQFQQRGLQAGECPDAWNLSHPRMVQDIAASYVSAGSSVVLTNTFGANRIALSRHGLSDQTKAINTAGVELSRTSAGSQAHVFASIGPTGKMLMTEEVTEEELRSAFDEQVFALAAGGAEGLVIETMSDLDEAKIALAAALRTGLPVVVSMVFDSGANNDRTMMGTTPEQAAAELQRLGADVIGANCGQGIEHYLPVCARLCKATSLPVWIKPNAGMPTLVEGRVVYTTDPGTFARGALALRKIGASFIGGCCGTTPDYIRAIRQALAAPNH